MYYTRCLSCKTALWRKTPFTFLDRVCTHCLDVLRARAKEEQFRMEDIDRIELAC